MRPALVSRGRRAAHSAALVAHAPRNLISRGRRAARSTAIKSLEIPKADGWTVRSHMAGGGLGTDQGSEAAGMADERKKERMRIIGCLASRL